MARLRLCSFMAGLLGVALVIGLGCKKEGSGGNAGSAGSGGGEKVRIAVIPKGTTHIFWKSVEAGAKKAGEELGVEIIWKGPLKEDDRGQQIGLVEQFVSEGVSGIVVAPLDATALLPPVQSANAKGIPVVIFDSPLNGQAGTDFVSLVATDNYKGGQMAGQELARLLDGKGKVVILKYAIGSASTEQREAGFFEAIGKHPGITIIEKDRYGGATVGEAQKNSENMLDKLREADGIFTSNESLTQGMLNVLTANNLAGQKKLVGFDSSPGLIAALEAGHLHATIAQNPVNMGHTAVTTIVKHLRGEKVEQTIDTGAYLITKQNLDSEEIRKLLGR